MENIKKYLENKSQKLHKWGYSNAANGINSLLYKIEEGKTITIEEIRQELLKILPREELKWEEEYLPDYLSGDKNIAYEAKEKMQKRIMKKDEYEKLMAQVQKYWSVLPDTNLREWRYWGWWWSLILSLTTGKIYDVEGSVKELLEDYKGKQYYSSRSWASGAGYIYAGKTSLVYLPSMRIDVAHPWSEWGFGDVNGVKMTLCTHRWEISTQDPTVIKDCCGVEVILLSQENYLQPDGAWKLLWEVIQSKGACLETLPTQTFETEYYDENLQKKTLSFTYKTNISDPKKINFSTIGKVFLDIQRGFPVEETGRFTDRMAGLRKYKDKYVRLWMFGLVKEVYDEYPISEGMEPLYVDEIRVGDNNVIERTSTEVPLSANEPVHINWWEIKNNIAYKKDRKTTYVSSYDFKKICEEHGVRPTDICEWFEVGGTINCKNQYHLIYEKKLTDLSGRFASLDKEYMEYELKIPNGVFQASDISYREEYMHKKLFEKATNERKNTQNRSEQEQKQKIQEYLINNPETKITVEDSYATGNCKPWTEEFIQEYRLPKKEILAKDLIKNKWFTAMLENSRFRAVILHKVVYEEVGEAF